MESDNGVDALMRILHNPQAANGRIFNIGHPDNEFSISDLSNLMASELAQFPRWQHIHRTKDLRVEPGTEYYGQGYQDVQVRRPDITNARTRLGWEPTVTMQEGLRRTIAYYLERDFQTSSPVHQTVLPAELRTHISQTKVR